MSLLEQLKDKKVWEDFRDYKIMHKQLRKDEESFLTVFIKEEHYRAVTDHLSFGYPIKILLARQSSARKRVVYSYSNEETWVLKLLAYLLYKYDDLFPENCYSFRKNRTAKTAFAAIKKIRDLDEKYILKADIHDYFNSIDTDLLIDILQERIEDDEELLSFLSDLLKQDRCIYEGEIIEEKRGAMAGVPLASFFANLYLIGLDEHFLDLKVPYFRYADDIILFCDSEEEQQEHYRYLQEYLKQMKLELNSDKLQLQKPHEAWTFLGFQYQDGQIDLSPVSIQKMKDKIKRKAGKLYRWRKKKHASYERAASAMIRSFDHRFYDLSGNNAFTWTRFYFPILTVDKGLREIDGYMLEYLRYLNSGHHNKSNYRISYNEIKKLGYTPLVSEYHRWKKENGKLARDNDHILTS